MKGYQESGWLRWLSLYIEQGIRTDEICCLQRKFRRRKKHEKNGVIFQMRLGGIIII